jgi:molybdopterin/thiamine biosynthesis adenylyltransferase
MATASVNDSIAQAAEERFRPDGTPYRSLSTANVCTLAERYQISQRRLEQAALAIEVVPERYARNMRSLSTADQQRLLENTVCIVGVGGLGGHVAEILARIGVGRLRLVDGDRFEDSNLNRQRFADAASLGHPKAQTAQQQIAVINPAVEVAVLSELLTEENGADLLGEADIAVDCLDSLTARLALQTACRQKKIPMVSAAVAGMSGQLTVIFPEDQGLAALYGDLAGAPDRGAETTLGNLPFAVSLLASLEGCETVKVLLGRTSSLHNRLLVFDLAEPLFEVIDLV